MSKVRPRREGQEMLPEYDYSGGVRGKYADRFAKGTIMVVLDPDPNSPIDRKGYHRLPCDSSARSTAQFLHLV